MLAKYSEKLSITRAWYALLITISYILNESYCSTAILICDTSESQKEGFILEKFYENNDFKTIYYTNNYPIMVFPTDVAEDIKKILDNVGKNKMLNP